MSLPHYKMTMLALTIGIASAMVGCSSNPKKEVVDTGPQSSEQVYIQKAEKKGRTKSEVDEIICWLTGYDEKELQ